MRILLVAACVFAAAHAANFECTKSANFILGLPYTQKSLTDACKDAAQANVKDGLGCDNNPVYGGNNCPKKAIKWCEAECGKQAGCVGFFFQKHWNGHEICGFYEGKCPKKTMHAPALRWVKHNHKFGSVCEKIYKKASKPSFPTPTKDTNSVRLVQGAVFFATRLAQTATGKKVFDLAFRTFVASSAGHVCGKGEACSPNDVVLTSFKGVSVSFRLRVANGRLATQAVAHIKTQLENGNRFQASLAAAGVTDVATLKKLVLGEKTKFEVQDDEPVQMSQQQPASGDAKSARIERILRILRCPKFLAALVGIMLLALSAILLVRFLRGPQHVQLEEVPAEVVVTVTTTKDGGKYEIVKEDFSKDQV